MSAWEVEIVLMGSPRGKGRPRFSRVSGRAYTDGKTASYEAALKYAGGEAMRGRPLLEGPLEIQITAYKEIAASWPKKKKQAAENDVIRPTSKPDGDNLAKMVDGLNMVVWADDSQITDWTIRKRYSTQPRLEIKIRRWFDCMG